MAHIVGNYHKYPRYSMKRSILFLMLALSTIVGLTSCEKQLEKIKSNALTNYLAANKWAVQQYLVDSTNITNEFDGYEFVFNENNTVTGYKESTVYIGTWSSNVSEATMTAQFAANTPLPVSRLNGTWGVSTHNSSATTFTQTINGSVVSLILRKK